MRRALREIATLTRELLDNLEARNARHRRDSIRRISCSAPDCFSQTIAMIETRSPYDPPDALCPEHVALAREWWTNGARCLHPARRILRGDAERISWDERAEWLTCGRCTGVRGPVVVITWDTYVSDHSARGLCASCWDDLTLSGSVSGLVVAHVPPLDHPTAAPDIHAIRSAQID